MKLSRVDMVNAVTVNGENKQTLYAPGGARNIRFEGGLVFFEDDAGLHWVPASNVRSASVEAAPKADALPPMRIPTAKAEAITKPERKVTKK